MKLLTLIAYLAAVLLSGCSGLIGNVSRPDSLTPEQIKAYNEAGLDVYMCGTIGGPPPSGNITWLTAPKGSKLAVKFSHNCQVMMQ